MSEDDDRSLLTRRRAIAGGGLLAVGGATAWTFRPAPVDDSEGWSERATMPTERGEMKGAVLEDRIHVPGGLTGLGDTTDRMDVYDPVADEWENAASMPEPLNHHAAATLEDVLYVVGGNREFDDPPEDHVFEYDPDADEWTERDPLPEGRWGHELVASDDRLYLVGGLTTDSHDVLIFDGETWDRGEPIPTPRDHLAAGVLDDRVLTVSGRWDGDNEPTVDAYDPDADAWEVIDAAPIPRSGTAGAVVGGRFHLGGGEDPAVLTGWTTDTHEVFDGEEWTTAPELPLSLHGPTAVSHDGALYVVGGAWRQGALSATAWSDRTFVYEP
ncbi:kelch repeat-containing protein [Natronococcus sp. A-GB1]|uniref:Kelch repeat-containing protein n=1 Tax=Natronococcus sp. A-GB1 TaxID=3037648 RepID=UPI00241D206A|nr:kelch repeat-containing protein [Natronococcus sp. A-GB1]MDG5760142.1 kelch repeat-containing protein [Natronococcus sp. A-GB1]